MFDSIIGIFEIKVHKMENQHIFDTVKMGDSKNTICIIDDVIFAKFNPISQYLGYHSSPLNKVSIQSIGQSNLKKLKVGKQEIWFINIEGLKHFLNQTKFDIKFSKISDIYSDVFDLKEYKDKERPFSYSYTDREMLDVIQEIHSKPINKDKVIRLLLNGKR